MHPLRPLLIAALAVCGCASWAAKPPVRAAACVPAAPRVVQEVFISADCDHCWQQADAAKPSARSLRLDWVVPGQRGDDAPLAMAALPDASERLKSALAAETGTVQRQELPAPPAGLRLEVSSGLAWNGYIGLSFDLVRGPKPLPPDASGWVALVERVPAGEDGTPVDRQLVRSLVGPLPLQAAATRRKLQHLNAVLLPPNGRVERLGAVGWIERADGRMLVAAQSPAAGCALGD